MVVRPHSPIGKCAAAPIAAAAARGATGGGARAFEVGMAVKVPMPSTCAAAATRAPDFVPLRGAPFAEKSCGPPAGRAKKSRVASRARAQEVPLDVATWPCRACDARSERACLEPAARIGLLLACSLALSVLLPALYNQSKQSWALTMPL